MIQDAPCFALRLVPEAKLFDECSVRGQVAALEIREEPAAGTNHLQQPSAAVMIFGMGPEVIGQGIDPLGEQCHLYLGGPGVVFVGLVLGRHGLFVEAHAA